MEHLTIVTGASSNHFKSVNQLINSLIRHESQSKIIFYDLGLSDSEFDSLKFTFPQVIMRKFPYENYPEWFNIHKDQGQYAWKPTIINIVAEEMNFKGFLLWLDAGCVVTKPLVELRAMISETGFQSGHGAVFYNRKWCHEESLKYFGIDPKNPEYNWILDDRMLAAGVPGFDLSSDVGKYLVVNWARLALVKEAIAPEGTSRYNHRQDQSVLTLLAYLLTKKGLCDKFVINHKLALEF